MDTEQVREHIKNLLEKNQLNLRKASLMVGQNTGYLYQYIHNKSPIRLPEKVRQSLASILGVNEQELTDLAVESTQSGLVQMDILDVKASCGNGIENFMPVCVGKQLISLNSLREITMSKPENIKIIKARGDSMEPTVNDSDVVWVDISYKTIDGDGIYVFCIGSQIILKRARVNFIDRSVVISSDNSLYPPITAKVAEEVRVIGKVIAINKMLG